MLIRKDLNRKRDLMIVFVLITIMAVVILVINRNKVYDSGVVDFLIEKISKYSAAFDNLF